MPPSLATAVMVLSAWWSELIGYDVMHMQEHEELTFSSFMEWAPFFALEVCFHIAFSVGIIMCIFAHLLQQLWARLIFMDARCEVCVCYDRTHSLSERNNPRDGSISVSLHNLSGIIYPVCIVTCALPDRV